MSSNSAGIPAGRLAQYAMLVASVPGLERRGSKAPYTSLNGNKSSFLTDTGRLALRLDSEGRQAFMREHDAHLCERHGRVMKEYVAVPERLWKQRKALRRAFVSSVAYVGSLKPKVSKRKKPVAKAAGTSNAVGKKTVVSKSEPAAAAAKKVAAKRVSAKKTPAKKPVAKKSAAKKGAPEKRTAKKSASDKGAPKKAAPKAAARKGGAVKRAVRSRKTVARA